MFLEYFGRQPRLAAPVNSRVAVDIRCHFSLNLPVSISVYAQVECAWLWSEHAWEHSSKCPYTSVAQTLFEPVQCFGVKRPGASRASGLIPSKPRKIKIEVCSRSKGPEPPSVFCLSVAKPSYSVLGSC